MASLLKRVSREMTSVTCRDTAPAATDLVADILVTLLRY
jgi:hypothetical protein